MRAVETIPLPKLICVAAFKHEKIAKNSRPINLSKLHLKNYKFQIINKTTICDLKPFLVNFYVAGISKDDEICIFVRF